MITAKLTGSRARIFDEEEAEKIYSKKYYGKYAEDEILELSLSETMHLIDRDIVELKDEEEKLSAKEAYERFSSIDSNFSKKYDVYSDLRERGYIVKSGFKFGTHFRVYPRGANPYKEGDKTQKDHTKWIVHAVRENEDIGFEEISRAVRLAHNIRAKMLWGVVDSEGGVTYYEVKHVKP